MTRCYLPVAVLLVGLAVVARAPADEPPPKTLTPAQQAQLKERDRLGAEAQKLRAAGKLAEAVAAAEQMLALERQLFGENHEDVAGSWELLADLQQERGDVPAARRAREAVLRLRATLHGANDWRTGDARRALADLQRWATMSPAERAAAQRAARLNQQVDTLLQAGRVREALQHARVALALGARIRGERHPDYADSLHNLALLYEAQGDYAKAEPLCQQALAQLGEQDATVHVGSNGDAFGVADNTTMTVLDLLLTTEAQAVNGVLYGGNSMRSNHANDVYSALNQAGDIS